LAVSARFQHSFEDYQESCGGRIADVPDVFLAVQANALVVRARVYSAKCLDHFAEDPDDDVASDDDDLGHGVVHYDDGSRDSEDDDGEMIDHDWIDDYTAPV